MKQTVYVTGLNLFPIKSLHAAVGADGEAIKEFFIDYRGPRVGAVRDRQAMLIKPDGRFISQRDTGMGIMTKIGVQLVVDGGGIANKVCVSAEGHAPLIIDLANVTGNVITAKMHDDEEMTVHQVAGDASAWFEKVLGMSDVRLVTQTDADIRYCDDKYAHQLNDEVGLADGFPVLITSQATLRHLNQGVRQEYEINRFRANIVVDGDGLSPKVENDWAEIWAGHARLIGVKPCQRCCITTINQETGIVDAKDMLKALSKLCGIEKLTDSGKTVKRPIFGMNFVGAKNGGGLVRVGDSVRVDKLISQNLHLA